MPDDSRNSTTHVNGDSDSVLQSRVEQLREELTGESSNEQPGWTEWFEFTDWKDSMLSEKTNSDSEKGSRSENAKTNSSGGSLGNLKERVTALRQELPDQSNAEDSGRPKTEDSSSDWTNWADFNQFEDSVR